jgi:hypothetical protein
MGMGAALVKHLLVVGLSAAAILAACLSVLRSYDVVTRCTNAMHMTSQRPVTDSTRYAWLEQPTTDEMAYAIFGKGVAVDLQAGSRYLNYIRTQIVRPSLLRPRTHMKAMNARESCISLHIAKLSLAEWQ